VRGMLCGTSNYTFGVLGAGGEASCLSIDGKSVACSSGGREPVGFAFDQILSGQQEEVFKGSVVEGGQM